MTTSLRHQTLEISMTCSEKHKQQVHLKLVSAMFEDSAATYKWNLQHLDPRTMTSDVTSTSPSRSEWSNDKCPDAIGPRARATAASLLLFVFCASFSVRPTKALDFLFDGVATLTRRSDTSFFNRQAQKIAQIHCTTDNTRIRFKRSGWRLAFCKVFLVGGVHIITSTIWRHGNRIDWQGLHVVGVRRARVATPADNLHGITTRRLHTYNIKHISPARRHWMLA